METKNPPKSCGTVGSGEERAGGDEGTSIFPRVLSNAVAYLRRRHPVKGLKWMCYSREDGVFNKSRKAPSEACWNRKSPREQWHLAGNAWAIFLPGWGVTT